MKTEQERFDAKWTPEPNSGCWLWIGAVSNSGYGTFTHNEQVTILAHRMSFMIHRGEIPKGLHVCHTCDTRSCVNPSHLFLGTRRDNMHDAVKKNRIAQGERNGASKLTKEIVLAIRANTGKQQSLADQFSITQSAVSNIKHKRRWTHI